MRVTATATSLTVRVSHPIVGDHLVVDGRLGTEEAGHEVVPGAIDRVGRPLMAGVGRGAILR
jgi:hypothetical protein